MYKSAARALGHTTWTWKSKGSSLQSSHVKMHNLGNMLPVPQQFLHEPENLSQAQEYQTQLMFTGTFCFKQHFPEEINLLHAYIHQVKTAHQYIFQAALVKNLAFSSMSQAKADVKNIVPSLIQTLELCVSKILNHKLQKMTYFHMLCL